MNIGIIYGSSSGATADAAKKLQKELALHGLGAELYDILGFDVKGLESFSHLFMVMVQSGSGIALKERLNRIAPGTQENHR
jgi:flavodoxin